jgi:FKBP-type peptidyl-prolyl cis-trans isomerase SlyD
MKAQIVSFHCILKNKVGTIISSTFNHDVITHVERPGNQLKGLIEGLQNLRKGDKRSISLSADQAYGFYKPDLVIEVSRKRLTQSDKLQVGNQVLAQSDDGETKVFRVTQINGNSVTLDGNHPLAGQDLIFEIETTETRDATSEEIAESFFSGSNLLFH